MIGIKKISSLFLLLIVYYNFY